MKSRDPSLPADMRLLGYVKSTGKFYCRIRRNGGKYIDPKCFVRHEDAVERRNSILRSMNVCVDAGGVTVAQWSEQWVAKLWLSYNTSKTKTKTAKDALDNLTSHVNAHVLKSSLAAIAVRSVTEDDIREFFDWLEKRDTQRSYNGESQPDVLSKYTRRRIAVTLRKLFAAAVAAGECRVTPVGKISLGKDQRKNKRVAHEVPLTRVQQKQLIAAYGKHPDAHMVILIIWIGLRLGELLNLEICDVHLDEDDPSDPTGKRKRSYLDVKYGGPNHQPPKGGKTRQVELFGEAKRVMKVWLTEILPKYAPYNPHGLVFPTRQVKTAKRTIRFRGGCRRSGPPPSWKKLQKSKVMGRRIWWHCLRHTCATSLLNNWFGLGRRWSIEEVANVLGHSSKEVTEMYAHLADGAMRDRAAEAEESYQRNLAAGGPEQDVPPAAPPVTAIAAVPSPALAIQPPAPDGSLADAVQSLLQRALKEKDAATAQALFLVSMQQHGMAAPPTAQPVAAPPPAPAPPIEPPGPPPVIEPAMAARLPRPMRKGAAGRRSRSTIAGDGDSEGPRKGGDLSQLGAPGPGSTDGLGWFPSSGASAGLSSGALATTVETRRATMEPGTRGVLLAVHPSTLELPPWRVAQTTTPANNRQAMGAPQVHSAIGCTEGAPEEASSWQYAGNKRSEVEQFPQLKPIERRSTEPKVGRSNRPGRAEQYQLVTTFPAPGYCQAIAKAPPEDERGPPPGRVESEAEVAPEQSHLSEPAVGADSDENPFARKAQWLITVAGADRQDAPRVAEDLAMQVLMTPAARQHHGTARLVLKKDEPNLRVPRGLQLAVLLLGSPPRAAAKKKRKP